MHLLMALVTAYSEIGGWEENLDVFQDLTIKGCTDVMSTLPKVDLRKHTAMQPLQLVSLLGLKLFQDSTDGNQTLSDIYAEYIKDLVSTPTYLARAIQPGCYLLTQCS